jgi:flagellin
MRINQNIVAMNAVPSPHVADSRLATSREKLSSGFRIDRASDDASDPAAGRTLRAQVSGLRQATRHAQDTISVVQTAEIALTEVHSMLDRIRDLVIQSAGIAQSASVTASDATARQAAHDEIDRLRSEVDGAIDAVAHLRGQLGAAQNRFETTIADLQVTTENLSASESHMRDADVAAEMADFTRTRIQQQAGTATHARPTSAPQSILRLLQ